MKKATLALALGTLALIGFVAVSEAAERRAMAVVTEAGFQPTKARYSRRYATHVRTYRGRRIGFYSYSYRDVINTYGMSRARYGSINSYRDAVRRHADAEWPIRPRLFLRLRNDAAWRQCTLLALSGCEAGLSARSWL